MAGVRIHCTGGFVIRQIICYVGARIELGSILFAVKALICYAIEAYLVHYTFVSYFAPPPIRKPNPNILPQRSLPRLQPSIIHTIPLFRRAAMTRSYRNRSCKLSKYRGLTIVSKQLFSILR